MSADVDAWKESVLRESVRLRIVIASNAVRLTPGQVASALEFIDAAVRAVGIELKTHEGKT
jgi:hypothetical protein